MTRSGRLRSINFWQRRPGIIRLGALLWVFLMLAPSGADAGGSVVNIKVPDLELINQNGETGRFVSEIIGDRLAAITFTYTTCTTICPILDGIFQNLQERIKDRLGRDIILITISIDPVNDVPERLKAHANKLNARPGWTFLTGRKEKVDRVLKGLEVFSADILNHPPTVFVVDGNRGVWSRLYGFPSAGLIEKTLNERRKGNGKT